MKMGAEWEKAVRQFSRMAMDKQNPPGVTVEVGGRGRNKGFMFRKSGYLMFTHADRRKKRGRGKRFYISCGLLMSRRATASVLIEFEGVTQGIFQDKQT